MNYQVYLRDADNALVAGEVFDASDDNEAAEIALALHVSCSDAYENCEVWRNLVCVARTSHSRMQRWVGVLEGLRRERQERLLLLEEALDLSYASLRKSPSLSLANLTLKQLLGR